MSKEKNSKWLSDSGVIKNGIISWLLLVWPGTVKIMAVEGTHPLPSKYISKSKFSVDLLLKIRFVLSDLPHWRMKDGFGTSSTSCIFCAHAQC